MHAILLFAVLAAIAAPDSTTPAQQSSDGTILRVPPSHGMPSTPGDSGIDPRMPMMSPGGEARSDSLLHRLQSVAGTRSQVYNMPMIKGDTAIDPNMPVAGEEKFLTPDQQPFPIKRVDPKTPEGFHGKAAVWVQALVDTEGVVQDVRVIKSDDVSLNIPAMIAARQWTFRPAMLAKKRIQIWVSIPFHFGR